MLHWLANNWGTILVCLVLLAVVALIVIAQLRTRRKGGSSCGCGCPGCTSGCGAGCGTCHPKK